MKLFLFWIQVRKLGSSGVARGISHYSLFEMGLGLLIVITSDRAHLLRKVVLTG